jgi:hypothetical protein
LTVSIKGIAKVGTPTGTFANLTNEDGTLLSILDVANDIDWVLGFDIGGSNRASTVAVYANVNGNNDTMLVQAYDFVGVGWDQVGIINGTGGAVFSRLNPSLLAEHTGTGADLGKVYIRFSTPGGSTPSLLEIDKCTVGVVNLSESVGYENASVWINETSGVAGVEAFVNGVGDNPCLSYANAIAIASSVGLNRYTYATGDTITITQSHVFDSFFGLNYTLALANNVPPTYVEGAEVTGIANGTTAHYLRDCRAGTTGTALTLNAGSVMIQCGIVNVKLKDAGAAALDVEFLDCHGNTQGSMTGGTVDFGTTAGTNHEVSFQRWGGPVTILNLKSGDTVFMHGNGATTLDASCTGGSFRCAGEMNLIDNSSGAVTIVDDGRLTGSKIADQVADEILSGHTDAGSLGQALTDILVDTATTIPGTITTLQTSVDDVPTNAELNLRTLATADYFDPALDTVALVTLVTTTTTVTNQHTLAEINTQVDTALTDIHLDHLMAAAAADVIVDGSVIAHMVSTTEDWSTFVPSTDSLQAQRDNIGTPAGASIAADLVVIDDFVDGLETTIGVAGAGLGDLGGMSTAMAAEVNAEVDTAFTTTTYGEPAQGAPGVTVSMEEKISVLYIAWRNKSTQTATTYSLFNDDASTVDHKATVSDDATTATKAEIVTGP